MNHQPITSEAKEAASKADEAAVRAALVEASGNMRLASEALGCSYATIKRRVNTYGLAAWLRKEYPLGVRQPSRKKRC